MTFLIHPKIDVNSTGMVSTITTQQYMIRVKLWTFIYKFIQVQHMAKSLLYTNVALLIVEW